MRIFILEDDEVRIHRFLEAASKVLDKHHVTVARDAIEAKDKFQPPYDLLLLDHDLGNRHYVDTLDENTGSAFCKWLALVHPELVAYVVVHSYNEAGAKNMLSILAEMPNLSPGPLWLPFGPTILKWLEVGQA